MKKAKTQTGLIKLEPKGKTARKIDKPKKASNKKQAKQRKAAKLAEKKKRKQGGKGRPFRAKAWADYAKGEKPINAYTTDELRSIVKRTAKAANNRLRALEKAGFAQKSAYRGAMNQLGKEVPRYKERVAESSREELKKEFLQLRDFMTAPTSTVTGAKTRQHKMLAMAHEMGYTGTDMDLSALFEKYMTAEWERIIDSPTIYQEIMSGRAAQGSLEYMREKRERAAQLGRMAEEDSFEGQLLLESLRRYGKKGP